MVRPWIGTYEVLRRLDGSASDEVLLARAHGPGGFQRTVVLKRHLAPCEPDSATLRAIAREAVAYALLTHPSIVRMYDFVLIDNRPTLVLEHVPGMALGTLAARLEARGLRLDDAAALYVAHGIFSGLAAAHAARHGETGEFAPVIHRDVNPGSVLLGWGGEVKLANFAIAKVAGVSGMTRPGTLLGTYGYMAPEQAAGDLVSVRTDVYLATVVLYELLTGRRAFDASLPEFELLSSMAEPRVEPLGRIRAGLDPSLYDAVATGLARDPEARCLSAADVASTLAAILDVNLGRELLMASLSRARGDAAGVEPDRTAETQRGRLPRRTPVPPPPRATTPTLLVGLPSFHDLTPAAPPRTLRAESFAPRPASPPSDTPPPVPMAALPSTPRGTRVGARSSGRGATIAATSLAVLLGIAATSVAIVRPGGRRGAAAVVSEGASEEAAAARAIASEPPAASAFEPASEAAPIETASPTALADASAPASRPSAPVEAPRFGVLRIPTSAGRAYVDGRPIGDAPGEFSVRCGSHWIRVGYAGNDVHVDVPCGGAVVGH